jgi:hypothetical protein
MHVWQITREEKEKKRSPDTTKVESNRTGEAQMHGVAIQCMQYARWKSPGGEGQFGSPIQFLVLDIQGMVDKHRWGGVAGFSA